MSSGKERIHTVPVIAAIVVLLAAFAVLFLTGCQKIGLQGKDVNDVSKLGTLLGRDSTRLVFLINETGEMLDGSVLINEQYLGNTTNGAIVLKKKALALGALALSGKDTSGNDFKFSFAISASDSGFDSITFQVPLKEYKKAVFDATKLDTGKVEQEIFALANEERAKLGIGPLRWNEKVADVARSYSKALPEEGFHHTDAKGRDVKKRLADSGIIFIAANENLFLSGSMTEETDLARSTVDGWLGSPGHRATLLDRDKLYSDAGVGVHCERKECYVVMNFAALRQEQKLALKKGWVTFHYLHNPGYNFASETVTVDFELSTTDQVNVYVVPSYDGYEEFVNGEMRSVLSEFKNVNYVNERFRAARGTGVIIEAKTSDSAGQFSLDFS